MTRARYNYSDNTLIKESGEKIGCFPECRQVFHEGWIYEEGVHYELRQVPCPYFDHIDDPVEYSDEAFPLHPLKEQAAGQDEFYKEARKIRHGNSAYDIAWVEGYVAAMKKQKADAISFVKWIASQDSALRLTLIDHNWYWEDDKDGDQPLTEERLYEIYSQSSITKK